MVHDGYTFCPIQDCVPGGWISKSRLNGISITSRQEASRNGGIIVFPSDASAEEGFWDRLSKWSREGIGPGQRRVTVGRFLKGRFETEQEQFDQSSVGLEIEDVDEEELVEIAAQIARELDQTEVMVKFAVLGRILVASAT